MNKWRDTSQSINLWLWQKSRELILKKCYITDKITQKAIHRTNSAEQPQQHRRFQPHRLAATTLIHRPFPHSKANTSSPFAKRTRKIQMANSEVDFSINLKRGLMNIKKFNIYTQCSFPRKEQTHQTLSERGFFMDLCTLVEWELLYLRRHIYVI